MSDYFLLAFEHCDFVCSKLYATVCVCVRVTALLKHVIRKAHLASTLAIIDIFKQSDCFYSCNLLKCFLIHLHAQSICQIIK